MTTPQWLSIARIVVGGVLLAGVWFGVGLLPYGERELSSLENIYGVPYPRTADRIQITEQLAHADLYLREPVIGKLVTLTIRFNPRDVEALAVGIRENEFWLSYPLTVFYRRDGDVTLETVVAASVTIPLTDKLPDRDGSVDVMLFANTETAVVPGPALADRTSWELHDMTATVYPGWPTRGQLRDAARSILTRERLL